jgi:hypothetical protein
MGQKRNLSPPRLRPPYCPHPCPHGTQQLSGVHAKHGFAMTRGGGGARLRQAPTVRAPDAEE